MRMLKFYIQFFSSAKHLLSNQINFSKLINEIYNILYKV